jgi:anti-sigma B factor antagonist
MAFAIDTQQHGDVALVVVRGELDMATAPQLRETLAAVLRECRHVVVDLERVDFVDSFGIGILLGGLKRARGQGGGLVLVCTSRTVLRPFEITGLDRVFSIHDRREGALAAAAAGGGG